MNESSRKALEALDPEWDYFLGCYEAFKDRIPKLNQGNLAELAEWLAIQGIDKDRCMVFAVVLADRFRFERDVASGLSRPGEIRRDAEKIRDRSRKLAKSLQEFIEVVPLARRRLPGVLVTSESKSDDQRWQWTFAGTEEGLRIRSLIDADAFGALESLAMAAEGLAESTPSDPGGQAGGDAMADQRLAYNCRCFLLQHKINASSARDENLSQLIERVGKAAIGKVSKTWANRLAGIAPKVAREQEGGPLIF